MIARRMSGHGPSRTETQSARAGFPAGAIPTVDFLLQEVGRVVKKGRVKIYVSSRERFVDGGGGPERVQRAEMAALVGRHCWHGAFCAKQPARSRGRLHCP